MAESISHARANLPPSLAAYLPADADALKNATVHWLQTHAKEIRTVGADFGRAWTGPLTRARFGERLGVER